MATLVDVLHPSAGQEDKRDHKDRQNTVSLTINRIGSNPTVAKSFRCAFIPIADMEITSNQVESVSNRFLSRQ